MRRRHIAATLLAGSLLVGLAACGSDSNGGSAATTTATTTAGGGSFTPITADTLTVVTSLPGPGFWNGEDPDAITGGLEYEMAKALQAKLGMKNLKVRNENFDAIVTGAVKDYDIALSQVTITDDRAKVVDFSPPYFESQQGILVKAGTKVATVDDAKKLKWAVQTGTTGELLINEKLKPTQEAQPFQDLSAAFAALDAGQVDAVAMDTAIVLGQAANSNGKQEVAAQFTQPGGPDKYGAIYPKDTKNKAVFDAAISGFISDGSVAKWASQWLTKSPSDLTTITLG